MHALDASLMVFRTNGPCTVPAQMSTVTAVMEVTDTQRRRRLGGGGGGGGGITPPSALVKKHSLPSTFTEHEPSDGSESRRNTTRLRFTQASQRPEQVGEGRGG